MGNGTPLTADHDTVTGFRAASQPAAPKRAAHLQIDVPLLLIVIMLLVFGLLMVYSASWDYSLMILHQEPTYMFKRQLLWAGLGCLVALALSFFDYHIFRRLAIPMMLVIIGSLVSVLVLGIVINNAARTLFGGSVQPSEFAKLAMIIYLSVWLYAKRDQLGDVSFGMVPLILILGTLGGLIILQPDLSATTTIFILGGILFFLAGGDLRQILALLVGSTVVGWVVFRLHPTGQSRLSEYIETLKDITQAPIHLARALEAVVKGGWFGVGIGRADTKLTGLPVPPTDSIFAVVAEETGLVGAAIVVLLFALLMWRGLVIAQRAPDGLGRLLAAGLSVWLALEALINMAVIIGLVPFAGNALPFISAGGSNLLVSLAAIGILMNISRQSALRRETRERAFDAVVDLRRRDWRRRLSRPRRAPRAAK